MDFKTPNNIRKRQIFFQSPSHELLYLRGGRKDKVVFGALCGLVATGSALCVFNFYKIIRGEVPSS